jgi:hypothetical protein
MSELAKIAAILRSVQTRETEFLGRFAAEILIQRPMFLDGMLADLDRYEMRSAAAGADSAHIRRHDPGHPTKRA